VRDSRTQKTITPIDGSLLVERPLATERSIEPALASAVAGQRKWEARAGGRAGGHRTPDGRVARRAPTNKKGPPR
jgi:hypothetical protein